MSRILTYAPLSLFSYQLYLAYTGKDPYKVFDVITDLVPPHAAARLFTFLVNAQYFVRFELGDLLRSFRF
jgi:hypothetical protein